MLEQAKLQIVLLILGIIASVLSIIKTVMDIIEKMENKKKAQNRPKPRKHGKRK